MVQIPVFAPAPVVAWLAVAVVQFAVVAVAGEYSSCTPRTARCHIPEQQSDMVFGKRMPGMRLTAERATPGTYLLVVDGMRYTDTMSPTVDSRAFLLDCSPACTKAKDKQRARRRSSRLAHVGFT